MIAVPRWAEVGGAALDFLFPRRCVGCGRAGDFFCGNCRRTLPRIAGPVCPRCGRPQASGIACPECVNWLSQLDGIRSPFRFDGAVRQAVHQLKYQNLRALAAPLGDFLAEFLETSDIAADVIVPVPLHSKRLRERGYNQSALLARKLGKGAGLPVVEGCLERVKATLPQARTTAVAERQQNMAGAFACRSERLKDRRVLLVDDVATSGATLDAAAAALKAGGAASVWGLTLAREI